MFEKELEFYNNNEKEFQKKYLHKKLLLVGDELIGIFNNDADALNEAFTRDYKPGTFMIKEVLSDTEKVQKFYSRVD